MNCLEISKVQVDTNNLSQLRVAVKYELWIAYAELILSGYIFGA